MTTFDPIPSWRGSTLDIRVATTVPDDATVVGLPVAADGAVPERAGFDRATLDASDFSRIRGPDAGPPAGRWTTRHRDRPGSPGRPWGRPPIRDAAAWFAQRAHRHAELVLDLRGIDDIGGQRRSAQAAVEGVVLARYRYRVFADRPEDAPLASLTLVVDGRRAVATRSGAGARPGHGPRDEPRARPVQRAGDPPHRDADGRCRQGGRAGGRASTSRSSIRRPW